MKKKVTRKKPELGTEKPKPLTTPQRRLLVQLRAGFLIVRAKTGERHTSRGATFEWGLVLARSIEGADFGTPVNSRVLDGLIERGLVTEIHYEAPKFEGLGDLLRWSNVPREKYRLTKAGRAV